MLASATPEAILLASATTTQNDKAICRCSKVDSHIVYVAFSIGCLVALDLVYLLVLVSGCVVSFSGVCHLSSYRLILFRVSIG